MLQVDRQEDFLQDVLSFGLVSNDPVGNRENLAAVAMEQQRETVGTSLTYMAQQNIVSERVDMLV
ncbi:MAG TPA: hypothetical protein VHM88_08705, partial [Candidatus Acidoferrales bacterium]|nr:hypothetical protein [Candidatus Acidoferrales bacterium]